MRRCLIIDIETYSPTSLKDCGVYAYAADPGFELLLLAYAYDDEPVQLIDIANGEEIPASLLADLADPDVIKEAYNASFERTCLARWLGVPMPPEQWEDIMIHASYLGLPRSLDAVCEALRLAEDEAKMKEGKALIRYFCAPCKPTKANGGRTRNLPEHAPDKWEVFRQYCIRDVESERTVSRRLAKHPVPEHEWEVWRLDQGINDRGVMVDMPLAEAAVAVSRQNTNSLTEELAKLTGLDNPNSVAQLKAWLADEGETTDSLSKAWVAERIGQLPDSTVRRVLEARKELGKSSVKKYETMLRCADPEDHRVRGTLQHYGANRTGRWAGRLVQVQNLPQNHLEDLSEARETVQTHDASWVRMLYGSVSDTLSQLIRTAFIPKPGHLFVVSDFSAIEARLTAWLAGEEWRQEVFRTGGDIYCMSASQMFHVPVEKHGINGHLRQKGKVAELACIAKGSLVPTLERGEVPIETVRKGEHVYDGERWVRTEGAVYKGRRRVISYGGLTATEDHLVWVEGQRKPIQFGHAAESGSRLRLSDYRRSDLWLGKGHKPGETLDEGLAQTVCAGGMPRVRTDWLDESGEPEAWSVERMPEMFTTETSSNLDREAVHCRETALHQPERRELQELRCEGHTVRVQERGRSVSVHGGELRSTSEVNGNRQNRRERKLRSGESAMGNASTELPESAEVYDLIDCGENHRFTVSGVIVHNCGYGGGPGALVAMGALSMGLTEDELPDIVQKWREASPNVVDLWWKVDNAAHYAIQTHDWSADIGHGLRYGWADGMLIAHLPSGRELFYAGARECEGKFDKPGIRYRGANWQFEQTYGPKLVENAIQAIGRDCLAEAMLKVSKRYNIVMHVHDEMIAEVPSGEAEEALRFMGECMAEELPWGNGLVLRGDGYICDFYRKD